MRRTRFLISLLLLIVVVSPVRAERRLDLGLEQDFLPYVTGGYYAGVWAGSGHLRGRVLTAHVHKPDAFVPEGFTNNVITAYAAVADYFPKAGWAGPWASAGVVYWRSSIQSDQQLSTANFENYLLNGSAGYAWKFHGNFYVSPWAGLHVRVGGDTRVPVDTRVYEPPLLNPEASIKVGWYFAAK